MLSMFSFFLSRQPWAIDGVLPTFLGASPVPASEVWLSLSGFLVFYSALAVADVFLLVRMIRRGPDGLGFWPPELPTPPEPREQPVPPGL